MGELPKDFPAFQTVEWWIEQLKEYNPKAIVVVASCYLAAPFCMLSSYAGDGKSDDKTKRVYIDVGRSDD